MIQVKNCSCSDLVIDNITIPSFTEQLFTSFTDMVYVNKLINQHLISIQYIKPSTDIEENTINVSKIEKSITSNNVTKKTDLSNFSKLNMSKKKKAKDIDTEAEKSNLEKGDIDNATD